MKIILYNVFYLDTTYGDPPEYEVTTDSFDKWLKDHNKGRITDGEEPEYEHEFRVDEVYLKLFNKENSNES